MRGATANIGASKIRKAIDMKPITFPNPFLLLGAFADFGSKRSVALFFVRLITMAVLVHCVLPMLIAF